MNQGANRPQQGRFEYTRPRGTLGFPGRVAHVRANDKESGSDADDHRASGERPAPLVRTIIAIVRSVEQDGRRFRQDEVRA